MNGFKSNFHSEFACDSDSDVSEAGYLQLRHQQTDPVAAGPWQQSPLPLLASTASCGAPRGVFTNGLFSPDATTTLQAETPQAATCASSSAMEQSAAAQPDSQAAEKLMSVLLDRVEALEQRASSLQVLAVGGHSATSATSPLRVTNGTASSLIEELDRNLSDIQQACHEEPHVDGSAIEARLIEVRRLLHERAEQGGAVAAGDASDAIRLRAELAHLANRLTGEMAEVREFVTSETSDICAFVEERIEEALQQATAQRTQQQQQRRQQEQQQLPGLAGQPSGGRLTIATVQPDNLAMWSPSSAPAAALWSPTSSGRGDVGDAAAMAELPRSVQELWQYMQRGMQRVEGLRGHMEEHLAAVRTLCGFADDRIADINRLHDRFEERIEDLHASHRDLERKLARLHSEQARSAGQVQALSAVASSLPRQLSRGASPPASSAGSNADSEDAAPSAPSPSGAAALQAVKASAAGPLRLLLNLGVLAAVAVLLAVVALANEPYLVAT